jgi:hypothetical protein
MKMSKQQKTSNISSFENLLHGFSGDIDGALSEIQCCRDRFNAPISNVRQASLNDADQHNHGRNGDKRDEYLQLREALNSAEDQISYLHTRNIELMAVDTLRCNRCDIEISELRNRIKQLEKSSKLDDQFSFIFDSPNLSPVNTKASSLGKMLHSRNRSGVTRKEELRFSTAFCDTRMFGADCLDIVGVSCRSDALLAGNTPLSSEKTEPAAPPGCRNSKSQSQPQLSTPCQCPYPVFVIDKDAECMDLGSAVDETSPEEFSLVQDTESSLAKILELQTALASSQSEAQELREKLGFQIVENSRLETTLLDALDIHNIQKVQSNQMAAIRGQIALLHFEAEEYRIHITEQEKLIKNLSVIYLEELSSDR